MGQNITNIHISWMSAAYYGLSTATKCISM